MNEYIVVTASNLPELEGRVRVKLIDGWICQGGVSCFIKGKVNTTVVYLQAMVRK